MKSQTQKGFSLIEMIIVVSIFVLLVGGSVVAFSRFGEKQIVKSTVSEILSELDEARSLTLASYDNTVYGVHIESDQIIFFKGSIYSPSDPDNNIIELSEKVSISNISLFGGGDDVIFQRLTGKTDQYGTLTISLVSDPTETETITIQESGIIESDI